VGFWCPVSKGDILVSRFWSASPLKSIREGKCAVISLLVPGPLPGRTALKQAYAKQMLQLGNERAGLGRHPAAYPQQPRLVAALFADYRGV
jgi:hypothetical protein